MISRRQYFSIVLIMVAVFLLFQGTQLGREHWGREQQLNGNAGETHLRSDAVWSAPEPAADGTDAAQPDGARQGLAAGRIVCLAPESSPEAEAAAQWARYAKRSLSFAASAEDAACAAAQLVLVPGDALAGQTDALNALTARGVNLLCLSLPDVETVESDDALRALLGIGRIYRPAVTLEGLHLFGGFLLGGERIYVPESEEEAARRQDLPLETPWYIVRGGTETYLQGVLSDADTAVMEAEGLKNEDRPAIWWRHHSGSAEVFAVNGPYMADPAVAGGVLQAALSRLEETSVYPVLDAQVFSVVDFPALSNENSEELLGLYGREMTDITGQIILPSLVPLPNRFGIILTAFAAAQTDYGDNAAPQIGLLGQMGKTLREMHSELALSLHARGTTPLALRLAEDSAALEREPERVAVSAVWAEDAELIELAGADAGCLADVRTVLTAPKDGAPPVEYLSENVTLLRATGDASGHSFYQDLRLLCRETSLGYDSSYCDLSTVWYPEEEGDLWQKRVEQVVSNITTFNRPFAAFEHVTASDCDAKARRYLLIDYELYRRDDVITLLVTPAPTKCSFVLRLNGEKITDMTGGDWSEIESGAYLLRCESGYVEVHVAPTGSLAELRG